MKPRCIDLFMETIGRYEILGELGRGGCGIVYRALDPSIGRSVAIKTIRLDSDSGDLRERFRREARSAGILSHPNIVTIHEFNDTGDLMFIAMEYIDGQTLAQLMREGLLPVEFTLGTLRAAADALDFAHAHHIVHRDVKPANFLITKHGHLKMADFGIAKLLDGDVGLTNTGVVVGTAQYMSPEQIGSKEVTGRSDQFSLAVIAYEMLTGRRPFQGDSWPSMMHAIIANEPPPLSRYQKELGDDVTAALGKGLAKDPQNRYPTCKAFAQALEFSILGATSDRAPSWQGTVVPSPAKGEPETLEMASAPTPTRTEARSSKIPASPAEAAPSSATPPTSTREVVPPGPPVTTPARSWAVPIVTGVVIVLGLGAWVGLRTFHSPDTPPAAVTGAPAAGSKSPASTSGPPVTSSSAPPAVADAPPPGPESSPALTAGPSASSPAPPAAAPSAPVPRVPGATSKGPAKQVARESTGTEPARAAGTPSLPLTTTPTPVPSPAITTQTSPPPVVVSAPAVSSAPVALPAAAPKKAEVDRTAEDARRAADEQAKRLKDEEAKAAVEEKAKGVRAAELQAVSRALSDYQRAYEHKDPAALQAIWPSLSKASLDQIRTSFHDASEVSVDLRPMGDPEISGAIATVVCDRTVHQIIMKRPMQASDRVRIVLNRRGAGWVITSIDKVSQ